MSISANVADLKNRLSEYLSLVEKGEEVVVCKRNVPFAKLTPMRTAANRSKFGWARGSVQILGDVTGPIMEDDWLMLR